MIRIFLLAAFLATLASPDSTAQVFSRYADTPSKIDTFTLKDGTRLRGEVLEVDAMGRAKLKVSIEGGSMQRTIALDAMEPRSAFRVEALIAPEDDADAQLALAGKAIDDGLVNSARRAIGNAREAGADENALNDLDARLERRQADLLVEQIDESLRSGKVSTARRHLLTLQARHPEFATEAKVQELTSRIDGRELELQRLAEEKRQKEQSDRLAKERAGKIRPLDKGLADAQRARSKGLENSKHVSAAKNDFLKAESLSHQVIRRVDQLARDRKWVNDEPMQAELGRVRGEAHKLWIDSLMSSASMYLTRGSINNAMGQVNKVIAVEPNNRQALAMRGRIETAANQGWRW